MLKAWNFHGYNTFANFHFSVFCIKYAQHIVCGSKRWVLYIVYCKVKKQIFNFDEGIEDNDMFFSLSLFFIYPDDPVDPVKKMEIPINTFANFHFSVFCIKGAQHIVYRSKLWVLYIVCY